jgi:hypothetical protein
LDEERGVKVGETQSRLGQNRISAILPLDMRLFFMVYYQGKKTLLFLGLKYCSNLLSYCSNLLSFQGKFDVKNIPMVI